MGRRFSNLPKCNPFQSSPVLFILVPSYSFPVFCLSSSIVLTRYFVISVNSMTAWSMLKLPKIAWPSPFKEATELRILWASQFSLGRNSVVVIIKAENIAPETKTKRKNLTKSLVSHNLFRARFIKPRMCLEWHGSFTIFNRFSKCITIKRWGLWWLNVDILGSLSSFGRCLP